MNNSLAEIDTDSLIVQARLAIRDIKHDGSKEGVSDALAALMRCATTYGWNEHVCKDLIWKAWSKRDRAGATIRRRRRRIQTGLSTMVEHLFQLEHSVKSIEFHQLAPEAVEPLAERAIA